MSKKLASEELLIGAHMSAAGGCFNAIEKGNKIGATTIQFFTSNQKQWHGKQITEEDAAIFREYKKNTSMQKVMSHGSYLINLGSPNPELLEKSINAFKKEIMRCHLLDVDYLNFHPGAYTSSDEKAGLDTIVNSLLSCKEVANEGNTRLLLETTAGQGTTLGHTFEQVGYILKHVKNDIPIGVCIDTCHIFTAGYDITSKEGWGKTLKSFETHIGLEHLYAFHLNDSKLPLGSKKDRHENLGKGCIGLECFKFLMQDDRVRHLPKYLETPNGETMWEDEIALLREFAKETPS
ncbi:deoxyribonuclease IV [Candidatus Aerophobetes bacterium]|uniref:Probable endonuclease 4 n=1 Tax=Aerophobetes bacterium TaxID=2030807 RepID=A0A2A4YC41_UNCAE|nr:MAG: deoxyribonuclease IV [Candidatus Aerophobetes bacterium]